MQKEEEQQIQIIDYDISHNILKKVCKLLKIQTLHQYSDAYYITYFITSALLWYSKDLLSYIYISTKTDILNIGSLLITELSTISSRVLKDSKDIQNEILDCIVKRTLFKYFCSFIGYHGYENINLQYEISNIINGKIILVQNEIKKAFLQDSINPADNINIEDIITKLNFVRFDNIGLNKQCPTSYKSLNNIIDNELIISIRNIKSRFDTKLKNKQIVIKNNVEYVLYTTIITFVLVIICIFLFKKTFVIKNTLKYFFKNDKICK